MLILDHVTKEYGTRLVLDSLSLQVPKGQMLGVIGRSGAGKSTMLRLINRLADPTGGSIRWDDVEVANLKGKALREWRTRCAMIFQQFNLVDRLDVLTNVLMGRLNRRPVLSSMFKRFAAEERARAVLALERLDLSGAVFQRAGTLSGGQQQRVAIARALMQEPEIILADEPIASLDPLNAAVVMDALRRINRENGITVLCNLHALDVARNYCDRIVGLRQGRIVFDGPPEKLSRAAAAEIYGVQDAAEAENAPALAL